MITLSCVALLKEGQNEKKKSVWQKSVRTEVKKTFTENVVSLILAL